jgi:uncharacterized membrane protein YsdA (DUF1294 family)
MTPELDRRAQELESEWRVRSMRLASLVLFFGSPAALLVQVLRFQLEHRQLYASLFLVAASFYLGWFLYRRVRGKEAAFGTARVGPETPAQTRATIEWLAVLAAMVLAAQLALNAWLGSWHA